MKFIIMTLVSIFLLYPYHLAAAYFEANDPKMIAIICSSITAFIMYLFLVIGYIWESVIDSVSGAFENISLD